MAVIVAKEYLRYHGNTRNLMDKHASGVKIHNMICTIFLLDTLGQYGVDDSREFNTWENSDMYLFERFYNGVCDLIEINPTRS